MYRYAVSFVDQAYTNIRDNMIPTTSNNNADSIQATVSGSGEVYANDLKEARVNANEKFVDKTIENIMKEKNSGAFYA
ncbi:hypothetical protein [Acetobacter okinawensis]|uniref:hypothetical protein n=1 Tax=Acetobacter okinawensis TaxID=1076594 RepID=UPI00046EF5EF|nr:hypothetical protein [Acetobacter okinawensis]MBS0965674.1 hypothetical protein [Acetobacter okinawensis]MBS0989852.1 hypothetical protein [Acetobacter okinawensis]MCP1213278.1 hypothetical protein [Acetobacter okinawensis]